MRFPIAFIFIAICLSCSRSKESGQASVDTINVAGDLSENSAQSLQISPAQEVAEPKLEKTIKDITSDELNNAIENFDYETIIRYIEMGLNEEDIAFLLELNNKILRRWGISTDKKVNILGNAIRMRNKSVIQKILLTNLPRYYYYEEGSSCWYDSLLNDLIRNDDIEMIKFLYQNGFEFDEHIKAGMLHLAGAGVIGEKEGSVILGSNAIEVEKYYRNLGYAF